MTTLKVDQEVGECVLGTATFSSRFPVVEVGRTAPMLASSEDPRAAVHAGFLSRTLPTEVNLLAAQKIQVALHNMRYVAQETATAQDPHDVVARRPSVGSVPPETLSLPWPDGASALAKTGTAGENVAALRAQHGPDGAFWSAMAREKALGPWLLELADLARKARLDLIAPPTCVVHPKLTTSPRFQAGLNLQVAARLGQMAGSTPDTLYAAHLHYSALNNPKLVNEMLAAMRSALDDGDARFSGVHIQFIDVQNVPRVNGRTDEAKRFVKKAAQIAKARGLLTWVADVGPMGPAFLDAGACFTSYRPGMTPRRIYGGGGGGDPMNTYGKTMALWEYMMLNRRQVEQRGDELPDTGLMNPAVPTHADTAPKYRVLYGKPQSMAVMEYHNERRLAALRNREDTRPGHTLLQRSKDDVIMPWGA